MINRENDSVVCSLSSAGSCLLEEKKKTLIVIISYSLLISFVCQCLCILKGISHRECDGTCLFCSDKYLNVMSLDCGLSCVFFADDEGILFSLKANRRLEEMLRERERGKRKRDDERKKNVFLVVESRSEEKNLFCSLKMFVCVIII